MYNVVLDKIYCVYKDVKYHVGILQKLQRIPYQLSNYTQLKESYIKTQLLIVFYQTAQY